MALTAQLLNSNSSSALPARCDYAGALSSRCCKNRSFPPQASALSSRQLSLSPVPLEILHARDLGCSWPWMLLGGTTYYWPGSYFSQARLLSYSRALSLNWLKKKKSSSKSLSKTPTSFASFQSAGELMEFPLGDFFPVSSLDRAQRRREGQVGRVRERTEIFHIFAVSLGLRLPRTG